MNIMDTKLCTRCDTRKNVSDFHRNKRTHDQLQTWCKVCLRAVIDARRLSAAGKAYTKDYITRNRTKMKAYQKIWNAENADRIREQKRLWYLAHKHLWSFCERRRAYARIQGPIYRAKNRDKLRAYALSYYYRDVETSRRKDREAYWANPEAARAKNRATYRRLKARRENT